MDVIGVGDADVDIYLDVPHLPGQDEKIMASGLSFHPGGMVANFLVALRRLGTSCGFNGPVGDDEFGRMTLADLAANGVDIRGAAIHAGERTYFCVVMLDSSGEKALVVAPTPCLSPSPADVSEPLIAGARHLHTTPSDLEATAHAVGLAKRHGLTVSVDIEPTAASNPAALWPLLRQVDLVFVNHRAASRLGGSESLPEAARQILTYGPQIVCITRGKAGSVIATQTAVFSSEAFSVPVVDSTGAGDCFAAGFVHGYLRGWAMPYVATFAGAVAALSVMRYGGHTGAPWSDAVQTFLDARAITQPD